MPVIVDPQPVSFHSLPEARAEVSLYPGELYVYTRGPEPRIWTLLGSCVSVILFSSSRKIGAICHAQLAELPHHHPEDINACTDTDEKEKRFRYLNCAFDFMLQNLVRKGASPREIKAYLLGGAAVGKTGSDYFQVGKKNLEMGKKMLQEHGIPIQMEKTGGNKGMTLYFYPASGDLYYRYHGDTLYTRISGSAGS